MYMDLKECCCCHLLLPCTKYHKGQYSCKVCGVMYTRARFNTDILKYFKMLLTAAKCRSKEVTITIDDIIKIHETQNGLCYYSKIPYVCKLFCNWKCSLERLDPSKGYISGNIALIICELQSASQWSHQKWIILHQLLNITHDKQIVDWSKVKYPRKSPEKVVKFTLDGIQYCKCNFCKLTKTLKGNFNSSGRCSKCQLLHEHKINATPLGHIKNILKSMKGNSKKKNKKKGRNFPQCNLKYQDLIDIFDKQGGLCYYSGIPMTFGMYRDKYWTCSPERINVTKGYTKDNIVLICYEFNTPVYTASAIQPENITEDSGWNIDKINYVKSLIH